MIQLSYNGELYSYDNKTSTTVTSTANIQVVLHPYVDIEGASLYYSQGDTEGIVEINDNTAEIPGTYLVTGDIQVALKLASGSMSNTFTLSVTKINSSGSVTDDDIQFTMDNKKRLILVPGSQTILAIQLDNESEIVTFKFPRYQEEVDLSTKVPYVNYKRPQVEDLGKALCTIDKVEEDTIYISWLVDATATQYEGTIQFQVEFYSSDGYRWQSQIGELPILTSLYNTGLEPYTPGVLEDYLRRMQDLCASITGVPVGGTIGQVLVKTSDTDYETAWADNLPSGGSPSQVLTIQQGANAAWNYAHDFYVWQLTVDSNDAVIDPSTGSAIGTASYDGPIAIAIDYYQKQPAVELTLATGALLRLPLVRYTLHSKYIFEAINGETVYTITHYYNSRTSSWATTYSSTWLASHDAALPSGGAAGKVLKKTSSSSYDVEWGDADGIPDPATKLDGDVLTYDSATGSWIASKDPLAEVYDNIGADFIGDLGDLTTTDQSNLVAAINEVKGDIPDVSGKQDKNLGSANAGKFLVVGSDGNITAVTMTAWQGGNY